MVVISLVACNPIPRPTETTKPETTPIEPTSEATVNETEVPKNPTIDFEGFPTDKEIEEWCGEHYGEAKFVNLVSLSEYDPEAVKYDSDNTALSSDKDSESKLSLSGRSDSQSFYSAYEHKQYKMKDIANDFEYIVYVYYNYSKPEYVIEESRTTFIQKYSENFFKTKENIFDSLKEKYGVDFQASPNQECFFIIDGSDEKALKAAGEEVCGLITEYDQREFLKKGEIVLVALYSGEEMIGYYNTQKEFTKE